MLLSFFLTGCNDYLDVVPKGDITTIESTFERKTGFRTWLVTCVSMRNEAIENLTVDPAFFGSDEVLADDYLHNSYSKYIPGAFIAEGKQKANNPYCNIWSETGYYGAIRYCNLVLDHIDGSTTLDTDEKAFYKAEIQACKAHLYFELVRRYGPIILVPKNIDANASTSEMQQPRSPIDSCFNAIVSLLDSAIVNLPDKNNIDYEYITVFTREGAATLKAIALLYAASPLFNGNQQFANFTNKNGVKLFPKYDKEKWHRAAIAADEAIEMAKAAGYKLESGSSDRPTALMNTMLDLENSCIGSNYANKEALLTLNEVIILTYPTARCMFYPPKVTSDKYGDSYVVGGISASMKMVEMFYTEHGLPLDEDMQWVASRYEMSKEGDSKYRNVVKLNTPVLSLHLRREPRFYASIISQGTYWYHKLNSSSSTYEAIDCNMLQGQIFGTNYRTYTSASAQCLTGYYVKKFDDSNVSKKDYCYHYYGLPGREFILFRLPDLLLASSEAWNEYLDQPDERVYKGIDEVRERAGIPSVEEAWSTYARNPQTYTTQTGMRDIIHQEWNIEFAFEGRRFYNLRRWMTAPKELNEAITGWNILGDTEEKFFNHYQGPIVVSTKHKFTAPRDYFFPINAEEVMISGVRQNPGW